MLIGLTYHGRLGEDFGGLTKLEIEEARAVLKYRIELAKFV